MSSTGKNTVRSFNIVIYDRELRERVSFAVPIAITAPFFNRLLREIFPDRAQNMREPWYLLIPREAGGAGFSRAPLPAGETSLYGERYAPQDEPPPRVSAHPDAGVGYFTVYLLELKDSIYQGDYSVNDIFLAGAEFLVRNWIEKQHMKLEDGPFHYMVSTSPKDVKTLGRDLVPPDIYRVQGVFHLPRLADDRERTVFHKVPPPPLPVRSAAAYGEAWTRGRGDEGVGKVLMSAEVYEALAEKLELSSSVEEGGYLLGVPYRQPGSPADEEDADFNWLIEITNVIRAEAAHGESGSLLFTGETWSRLTRQRDRDHPDKKLVAWFHTHLFEATDTFGLSGMDHDLHRRFLTKPWQVAVLINIGKGGERVVRCFQRGSDGDLAECAFSVFNPQVKEKLA
ncbi:MAG: hypothetical protein ABW208_20800 [Pyrinomonadaceae bacterium]